MKNKLIKNICLLAVLIAPCFATESKGGDAHFDALPKAGAKFNSGSHPAAYIECEAAAKVASVKYRANFAIKSHRPENKHARVGGLATVFSESPVKCLKISSIEIEGGKRGNGYGQAALHIALRVAEKKYLGIEGSWLTVHRTWGERAAARHIYTKMGFVEAKGDLLRSLGGDPGMPKFEYMFMWRPTPSEDAETHVDAGAAERAGGPEGMGGGSGGAPSV